MSGRRAGQSRDALSDNGAASRIGLAAALPGSGATPNITGGKANVTGGKAICQCRGRARHWWEAAPHWWEAARHWWEGARHWWEGMRPVTAPYATLAGSSATAVATRATVACRRATVTLLTAATVSRRAAAASPGATRLGGRAALELLGDPNEQSFGAADVAEAVGLLVLHHIPDELCADLAEPRERLVDVVHREHDAQVAESIHRSVPVIGNDGRCEESRKLEPAVAVRRDHHGDLDALRLQARDAARPLPFDHRPPLEPQTQLGEERDGVIERLHDDANVVHPRDGHVVSSLASR